MIGRPNTIGDFYDRCPLRPVNGCWNWAGTRDDCGYGAFKIRNQYWKAHRFSWNHANGDIPSGMHVLHKCDNPACVNPNHLFLGTHQDNMDDKMMKGRGNQPKGTKHPKAKLTREQIISIRADKRTQQAIADSHGVSQAAISSIKLRKLWRHIA